MANTYKTILVHVNDERRADRVISYAAELAEGQGAHLIGLYIVPLPVVLNEWPDMAIAEMMEAQRKSYREEGKRVGEKFREKTKLMTKPAEWRLHESQFATVDDPLVQNAQSADLVIVAQADTAWHLSQTLDAPEAVIMQSGRPVIVVPNAGIVQPAPKKVLVAWNGRKEATRAAYDAVPLIAKAGSVEVVWVDPRVGTSEAGDLPCSELAVTLARHGAKAEARAIKAADETVGTALLEECKRAGADLVVMGAYGHSRFREFVLGGATRNQMRNMTVPVLFSH